MLGQRIAPPRLAMHALRVCVSTRSLGTARPATGRLAPSLLTPNLRVSTLQHSTASARSGAHLALGSACTGRFDSPRHTHNSPTGAEVPASGQPAALASRPGRGGRGAGLRGVVVDLLQLSKAKLSAMVVVSASAGFLMAGSPVDVSTLVAVSGGTTLAAFSAATWNQMYEVHNDRAMHRTANRPLPAGRLTNAQAASWGALTGVGSVAVLAAGCNPLTALLGAGNIALYSLVYTPMKQWSVANTWVGAVVGAIPPLMGWAAATNTLLAPEAVSMAALLYLWQFPHFFALSWRARADYARGGYQMVAVLDESGQRTAQLARRYAWYLTALPLATSLAGVTSVMFAVESVVVNAYALRIAHQFYENPNKSTAQRVFLSSLWYLPLMMILMVFHSKRWDDQKKHNEQPAAHAALSAAEPGADAEEEAVPARDWQAAARALMSGDWEGAWAAPTATTLASAATPTGEVNAVDRAVSRVRKELSGLCPHEVMKEPDCASCPVGDRVVEEAEHVRVGAALVSTNVQRGVHVVASAAPLLAVSEEATGKAGDRAAAHVVGGTQAHEESR